MNAHTSLAATALATLLLVSTVTPAYAQEAPPPPVAPPSPGYTAPLYQTTQPSYVPQSVAMSGPHVIRDWDEGSPVPPGYHPSTRIRTGLVVGGAVLFGTLYFFSVLAAAAGADSASGSGQGNPEGALWVPGLGPFIQMGSTSSAVGNVFLAVDGAGQVAGLAMFIYGIASPRTVLVRNDLGGLHISPKPMTFGRSGGGMGLVGTF
jgi:hypothetical protein